MTAALASVLMQTQVFFTALLSVVLLGERLGKPLIGGLVLAALAILCFALHFVAASPGVVVVTVAGFVLNICGAAMWAASNIVARKAQAQSPGYDALAFLVWSSLIPIAPFVAMSALFDPAPLHWRWLAAPWTSWVAVAYLGWVATIAAYGMWTRLLKRHPANRVAPFSLGVPVVGLGAGMLILGERVSPWQWTGIGLVVAALVCVMFGNGLLAWGRGWFGRRR
jgi:O-acetylserine/cysteine efflux transporter